QAEILSPPRSSLLPDSQGDGKDRTGHGSARTSSRIWPNQARGCGISRHGPQKRPKWTIETPSEKIKTTYTPPSCVRFFGLGLFTQPRDGANGGPLCVHI